MGHEETERNRGGIMSKRARTSGEEQGLPPLTCLDLVPLCVVTGMYLPEYDLPALLFIVKFILGYSQLYLFYDIFSIRYLILDVAAQSATSYR